MLRMLRKLLQEYTRKSRIFLSWDAASWHMSKLLHAQIAEHNDAVIKGTVAGPLVELAPLPAGACRTGVPPPRPIVTFVNGRDGDICIWWTHPTLPLLASSGPRHHHIDVRATAFRADKPLAPIGHSRLGAVSGGRLGRIGLDLMLTVRASSRT